MNNPDDNQANPKAFVAIALAVLFYIGWNQYMAEKYPDWNKPPQPTAEQTAGDNKDPAPTPLENTGTAAPSVEPKAGSIRQLSDDELTFSTPLAVYKFSQYAGSLRSIVLKNYLDKKGDEAKPINLTSDPLYLQSTLSPSRIKPVVDQFHGERQGNRIRFWRQSGVWEVSQNFTIPEKGYGVAINFSYRNTSDRTQRLVSSVLMRETKAFPQLAGTFLPGASQARPSYIYSLDGEADREDIEGECNDSDPGPITQMTRASVDYLGIDNHYFLKILIPEAKSLSFALNKANMQADRCDVIVVGHEDQGEVKAGETVTLNFTGYFGPKDLEALESVAPVLANTVDYGIFAFIAKPLLLVVQGFYNATHNYGIAIIITTLLLKLLFFPLMKASAVSMHKMKKLNPQIQALREKYKDDRQQQQQAMMKFMTENKMNPMKGCFPILPQIPVFFAFWQVLRTSIDLRHADFGLWIHDLTAHDPYYVTPVLMGVAMFAQQKLTPTTGMDKTQEKIMMFIPIMFTVPMLTFPAGMTIYMLTNTLTSIAQQRWLYYKLDKQQNNTEAKT